jgi:general secretion pathway protein G
MEHLTTSGNSIRHGFTFIELMIVLSILALLVSIALPTYFNGLQLSKEAILRKDLSVMRESIDHYYNDRGIYPQNLNDLVAYKYIQEIPVDPITESSGTWILVPAGVSGIYNIKSGAQKKSISGKPYSDW